MDISVANVAASEVLSVHITFKPLGWATFYVDDARGTLAIESDWGSYAYRWGRGSWLGVEPPDLSLALRGRIGSDSDYIARKLLGAKVRAYCPETTRREWFRLIARRRRDGVLSRGTARDAWDEVSRADLGHPAIAWSDASDALREALGNDPCDLFFDSVTPAFLIVRDVLIPAFIAALRDRAAEAA